MSEEAHVYKSQHLALEQRVQALEENGGPPGPEGPEGAPGAAGPPGNLVLSNVAGLPVGPVLAIQGGAWVEVVPSSAVALLSGRLYIKGIGGLYADGGVPISTIGQLLGAKLILKEKVTPGDSNVSWLAPGQPIPSGLGIAGSAYLELAEVVAQGLVYFDPLQPDYSSGAPIIPTRDRNLITWSTDVITLESESGPYWDAVNSRFVVDGVSIKSTTNSNTPCIKIRTPRPVIIKNSNFWGWQPDSGAGGMILGDWPNVILDVTSCAFFGTRPTFARMCPAKAVNLRYGHKRFRFENNQLDGTGGITLNEGWTGSTLDATHITYVWSNRVRNIDGRVADPTSSTGWKHSNTWGKHDGTDGFIIACFVQSIDIRDHPRFVMGYNDIINEAGHSRCEDIFAFQRCRGASASSPIHVYRNLVRGHYVYDWGWTNQAFYGTNVPSNTPGYAGNNNGYNPALGLVNSGGSALMSDGWDTGDSASQRPGFILFEENYCLDMTNYGIAIHAGTDNIIKNCVTLRSGYVHNLNGGNAVKAAFRHLGIQIQDGSGSGFTAPHWANNQVIGTTYGYTAYAPSSPNTATNHLAQNLDKVTTLSNTEVLNVTTAMVDAAEAQIRGIWRAAGVNPGVLSA